MPAARPAAHRLGGGHDRRPGGRRVPEGTTILEACRDARHRHPDALLPRDPHAGERLPGLRGRGRGRAHAGARLLAQVEPGWRQTDTRAGAAQSRKLVLELLASSVDLSPRRRGPRTTSAGTSASRSASAAGARRRTPASAIAASRATTIAPDGRRGDRRAAGQGRQRSLRPRLREVHPLLQVRRGVRHRRPEHVRDRGRRPRVRRADLDRVRRPAAGLRVRLLRQLHRRLPDRRADVQERARPAAGGHVGRVAADRDRHHLPVLRRRLHARSSTSRTTEIVKVTSPLDHAVTRGHLCIKGRFGWQFVQNRPPADG